jgi:hypothetical protein
MADQAESKPPFWSSVPGMFTGLGAVIVAVTGLITALYSTGVIGTKAGSNSNANAAPANTSVPLASTAPPANPEHERFKSLAGKWEVIESPSQYFDKVDKVTWQYDATVSGNVLTLTGKIVAIDGDKNVSEDDGRMRATYVTTLIGSSGIGEYKLKKTDGSTVINEATIRLDENLKEFTGKFEEGEWTIKLSGRKQ